MPNKAYDWKMTIDGIGLCERAKLHVGSITYEESLTEAAELQFTISHSDSFRFDNSHISPHKGYKFADLGLGCKVQFWLGFVHDLRLLFTGEVIEIRPEFTQDDASHLSIRCHDLSYRLKRVPHPRVFTNATRLSIVNEIAEYHGLTPVVEPSGPLSDFQLQDDQAVVQKDETDWQIIEEIAKSGNYNVFVKHEYLVVADDEYLAGSDWHSKVDKDHPHRNLTFIYNASRQDLEAEGTRPLVSFRPGIGSDHQRKKIDIIGWVNYGGEGEKTGKAQLPTGKDRVYTDIKVRTEKVETLRILGETVHTQSQARALAQAEMERRARQLVRGDAVLANGEPGMRVGQKHSIQLNDMRPFGKMFSGGYVLEAVRHEIDREGACKTAFDIRRDGYT